MQMDTGGPPLTIEDTCIEHYGDGISTYEGSGSIVVRRVHLHETLFAGTAVETDAILAELGRGDGLTNGQRLAALIAMGCFRRVDRLEGESQDQFLARPLVELGGRSWNQKVASWKASQPRARCS